jgi:hypothetical protein
MNKDDLRHLDTNVDLAMYALAHDDDFSDAVRHRKGAEVFARR